MGKVVTLANEKGGVGKTTSTACLAWVLANHHGKKVLAIDFDGQGNLSDIFCESAKDSESSIFPSLRDNHFQPIQSHGIDIIPGGDSTWLFPDWANEQEDPSTIMLMWLAKHAATEYDFIFIDTPPHLGSIVANAYTAADYLVAVTEPLSFSYKAIDRMRETVDILVSEVNPDLKFKILITKYNGYNRDHESAKKALNEKYGDLVLKSVIERRVSIERLQFLFNQEGVRNKGVLPYLFVAQEILETSRAEGGQ